MGNYRMSKPLRANCFYDKNTESRQPWFYISKPLEIRGYCFLKCLCSNDFDVSTTSLASPKFGLLITIPPDTMWTT